MKLLKNIKLCKIIALHSLYSSFIIYRNLQTSIADFYEGIKTVGDSTSIFLSFDCFIQDTGMVQSDHTTEYFKTLMVFLCPFIFLIIVILVWLCIQICMRYSMIEFKSRVIISTCIVMLLLYPSIAIMAMGLFTCYEVDSGEYWLYKDLRIRCWNGSHPAWAFGLGIPMILLWVIGLPALGLYIVWNYRERLDDPLVLSRYKILFQGYRKEVFYWEFVNTLRKVSIIMINVFLSIYSPIYKAFAGTIALAIILTRQDYVQPYKVKIMNEVEFRESTTSIVTLFCGSFFILNNLPSTINIILIVLILICNIWFYSLWIHLFLKSSYFTIFKFISLIFGKISLLGTEYWKEENKIDKKEHDLSLVNENQVVEENKENQLVEEKKENFTRYGLTQGNDIKDYTERNINEEVSNLNIMPDKMHIDLENEEEQIVHIKEEIVKEEEIKRKKKKKIIKKKKTIKDTNKRYDVQDEKEKKNEVNVEQDATEISMSLPPILAKVSMSKKKKRKRGDTLKLTAMDEIKSELKEIVSENKCLAQTINSARNESKSSNKGSRKSHRSQNNSNRNDTSDRILPAFNPRTQEIQKEETVFSGDN